MSTTTTIDILSSSSKKKKSSKAKKNIAPLAPPPPAAAVLRNNDDDDDDDFQQQHQDDHNDDHNNDSDSDHEEDVTSRIIDENINNDENDENSDNNSSSGNTWSSLGISEWLCRHLDKLQMRLPTVIQSKCIPAILHGRHTIGMAQTGTGKTAAFTLPILQTLSRDMYGVYALILTPTRELAMQIKTHMEVLAGDLPLRVALLVGGLKQGDMAEMMDRGRPHVVVGTPAQVEAAVRTFATQTSKSSYFQRIKYLVFDEADQLLRSDASLDIGLILDACNPRRQTLLFSATMDRHVKKLASVALNNSKDVFVYDACKLYRTADGLTQHYMFMPAALKDCYLYALFKHIMNMSSTSSSSSPPICMVFFSSVQTCELATRTFQRLGIKCASLHAAKRQEDRFRVLDEFRNRRLFALMLTDVGNRGLDIPSVSHVINYDLPLKTKYYVHRVGRTARAGQVGTAVSMVSQFDVRRLQAIEKDIGLELDKYEPSTEGGGESGHGLDEESVEGLMYEVAEMRVKAKIDMLESGFVEDYADMKGRRDKSAREVAMAKIMYEKQLIDELKGARARVHDNNTHAHAHTHTADSSSAGNNNDNKVRVAKDSGGGSGSTVSVGGITLVGGGVGGGGKNKQKNKKKQNKKRDRETASGTVTAATNKKQKK